MNKIESEFQISSIKIRNEYKGDIDSCKSEYLKTIKELDKLEVTLNKERLIESTTNSDFDKDNAQKYKILDSKLSEQNKTLKSANKMGDDIVKTQANTLYELDRQKNQIIKIDGTLSEVEEQMSIHDQIFGVMNNRELFNKLKLFVIVALLFFADILVLYIKLF
jgi:hypothetical protein